MWTAIFIGVASLVVVALTGLGRSWLEGWKQAGRDELAAEEAARDRELARKQAEVMTEMRRASDAERTLDRGEF